MRWNVSRHCMRQTSELMRRIRRNLREQWSWWSRARTGTGVQEWCGSSRVCRDYLVAFARLVLPFRVDADRDRAIIDQVYFHVRAEDSAKDRSGNFRFKLCAEFFIELVCLIGRRCTNEGRSVAFSRAGKQRKLADDQEIACNVLHGKIHRSGLIRKNAQPGDLAGQPENVLLRIRGFNTKENQ